MPGQPRALTYQAIARHRVPLSIAAQRAPSWAWPSAPPAPGLGPFLSSRQGSPCRACLPPRPRARQISPLNWTW